MRETFLKSKPKGQNNDRKLEYTDKPEVITGVTEGSVFPARRATLVKMSPPSL